MSTSSAQSQPPRQAPIGPSVEQWRAMSNAEKDRFYQQIYDAFSASQEAMSQGRPHSRAKSAALDALVLHFKTTGRLIYVADELTVVYPGEPTFDPDLIAVLDVPQPDPDEDERMAWMVAEEGKGPDFILEVLHKGSRDKDLGRNVTEYARLGIREYFVYDRLHFKLYGYRLARSGGAYLPLRPRLGRLTSEVLGLDLALVERKLRFFSGMGELMNSEEFIERLSKMMDGIESRALQAEAQVAVAEAQVAESKDQVARFEAQLAEVDAQLAEADARVLLSEREAVLDLAEAYGLEITAERRLQLQAADLNALRAQRVLLKAKRAWA